MLFSLEDRFSETKKKSPNPLRFLFVSIHEWFIVSETKAHTGWVVLVFLLFFFLINICYVKFDFSFKYLLQWTKNQTIFSSLKICMLYFCYVYIYAFSVRSTTNRKHSAFFLFEKKPDNNFVLWPWQQMECSVLSQSLCYTQCASFLTTLDLKLWQDRVIWNITGCTGMYIYTIYPQ